jgi:hypothetical protein
MSDIGPHYQISQSNPKHTSVLKRSLPMGFALNLHRHFLTILIDVTLQSFLACRQYRRQCSEIITFFTSGARGSIYCTIFGWFHSLMLTSTLMMPSTYQIMATQLLGLPPATKSKTNIIFAYYI